MTPAETKRIGGLIKGCAAAMLEKGADVETVNACLAGMIPAFNRLIELERRIAQLERKIRTEVQLRETRR